MPRFSIDENSSSSEEETGVPVPKRRRVPFPSRVLYRHANSSGTPTAALLRQRPSGTTPSAGASTSQPISEKFSSEPAGESDSEEDDEVDEDEEEEEEDEYDDDEDMTPVSLTAPSTALSVQGSSSKNLAKGVSNEAAASGSKDGERRTSDVVAAILTDTDVLDCGICFEPLTIPLYQCDNGHTACSSCCGKLQNKCPSCCAPIGYNRCRGLEKVLEAVKITCFNSKYGCKERVRYSMKREHEQSCAYEACYCPVPGCYFDGAYKDLYLHFARKHATSATHFSFGSSFTVRIGAGASVKYKFLQEDDHTLFVLNYGGWPIGSVANIICIGPSSLQKQYSYELEASDAESCVQLTTLTQSHPKWTMGFPRDSLMLVPKVFVDSSGMYNIQVCIRKKGEK